MMRRNDHEGFSSTCNSTYSTDLSLQITPPMIHEETAEQDGNKLLHKSTTATLFGLGRSGSVLRREINNTDDNEPTLSLGLVETNSFTASPSNYGAASLHRHHHHVRIHHHQPYSADLKKNFRSKLGIHKRSIRAPRMRWTSTLHAHFVRAVEQLGGHDSKIEIDLFINFHTLITTHQFNHSFIDIIIILQERHLNQFWSWWPSKISLWRMSRAICRFSRLNQIKSHIYFRPHH